MNVYCVQEFKYVTLNLTPPYLNGTIMQPLMCTVEVKLKTGLKSEVSMVHINEISWVRTKLQPYPALCKKYPPFRQKKNYNPHPPF